MPHSDAEQVLLWMKERTEGLMELLFESPEAGAFFAKHWTERKRYVHVLISARASIVVSSERTLEYVAGRAIVILAFDANQAVRRVVEWLDMNKVSDSKLQVGVFSCEQLARKGNHENHGEQDGPVSEDAM